MYPCNSNYRRHYPSLLSYGLRSTPPEPSPDLTAQPTTANMPPAL